MYKKKYCFKHWDANKENDCVRICKVHTTFGDCRTMPLDMGLRAAHRARHLSWRPGKSKILTQANHDNNMVRRNDRLDI